ncbi:MAG: glucose-1-phosphate adenylyltransferase [Planctomycetota bacterium]
MPAQQLKSTLTFVLAGGQGGRLKPLTLSRAKPAVPFAGSYRIIDFALSNCIHSGLRRIYVLTQYHARSLDEHIRFGWNFLPRRLEQFVSVRAPHHQRTDKWYLGTADAMHHNLDAISSTHCDHVLVLAGDHVYRMDYGAMLEEHLDRGAALTIGAVKIPAEQSSSFGILEVDASGRVQSFVEKPAKGPEIPGEPGYCLGSMGIYLFNVDELLRRLEEDASLGAESAHDFGHDVIPRMISEVPVNAHFFTDPSGGVPYWRDVGTLDAYYEANLDLCTVAPQFNLYDRDWPIYSLWQNDPPAKTVFDEDNGRRAQVVDSLICPGVVVSGGTVRRSIVSNRAFVDERAEVEDSIVFKGVVVGAGAVVKRAIVDKWVEVPPGEQIGVDLERDRQRFTVTSSGIVVVPRKYQFDARPADGGATAANEQE